MVRVRVWWLAVVAWIGLIFFSSTTAASYWSEWAFSYLSGILMGGVPRDSSSYGALHLTADKGLHVTLFAVLAILLFKAMVSPKEKVLRILAFGLFVGCCSEYLQSFFPDRDPAFRDVLINVGGTALGAFVSQTYWAKRMADRRQTSRQYTFSASDGQ